MSVARGELVADGGMADDAQGDADADQPVRRVLRLQSLPRDRGNVRIKEQREVLHPSVLLQRRAHPSTQHNLTNLDLFDEGGFVFLVLFDDGHIGVGKAVV